MAWLTFSNPGEQTNHHECAELRHSAQLSRHESGRDRPSIAPAIPHPAGAHPSTRRSSVALLVILIGRNMQAADTDEKEHLLD
jgi:hypothetical protein